MGYTVHDLYEGHKMHQNYGIGNDRGIGDRGISDRGIGDRGISDRGTSDRMQLLEREDRVPCWYRSIVKPCAAEFIGTTLFVFVGCVSVSGEIVAHIAFAHGFMIFLLISAFGPISGGHFNPAVTLGAVIAGGTAPLLSVAYFFCQICGGLLGAGFAKAVLSAETYGYINGGAQDIGRAVTPGQAILCEMLLTTILVLTVLMTAIDTNLNTLAPLAIGLSITVCIFAGGSISGASMNPARSFGPAVVVSSQTTAFWNHHYVYWAGPLLGSLLASLIYRFLLGNDEKRVVFN